MEKPLRSQPTRDRILDAARRLFAEEGYERTTIRAVATMADIHPSMVMRYYTSKEGLFTAAASFDLEMPDLAKIPREDVGKTLAAHFLRRWGEKGEELPALLRVSVTHEPARLRLIELFGGQVLPALAAVCEPERLPLCAGLVATQMMGLALTRFVLRLPPVTAIPDEVLVEQVGATIQAYLTGEAR